ncbi:hypothetical protein [Geodermatophilus chilensis]|uniref:hypothetical protein n=1 Tax=Geodermatophilus chilensis TaxID=2035835 RepID=UPI000C2650DF|nr:hypothetical protein [Geodermatophilus chilensis]
MTPDGITHELAQVLYRAHADEPHAASRALQDAAALTATVERIAREHAADKLNEAADDPGNAWTRHPAFVTRSSLRARAAALWGDT